MLFQPGLFVLIQLFEKTTGDFYTKREKRIIIQLGYFYQIQSHVQDKRQSHVTNFPLLTCALLLISSTQNQQLHVTFVYNKCIGLFLAVHFLIWEILNLNLTFATCVYVTLNVCNADSNRWRLLSGCTFRNSQRNWVLEYVSDILLY